MPGTVGAIKSLSQIGSPSSIQVLLKALEDEMFDVRWLAAEGLIRIGHKAIVPILWDVSQEFKFILAM